MYLTTTALVLREVEYKDSDKLLTVLTPEQGKLTLSARGVRKKKDATAAACQVLTWAEFTLSQRQGRWQVKEAVTQRAFRGVREDLDKLALGSYFAQVTETLCEEEQPEPELLALTLNALYALDEMSVSLTQVKTAFEWKAMALAGYEPMVGECGVCGCETPEVPCLHLREGVLHCKGCREKLGEGVSMPLTGAALAALRYIMWGNPKRLFSFTLDDPSLRKLADASEAYLMTQLERGFHTLDFYKSLHTETMTYDRTT